MFGCNGSATVGREAPVGHRLFLALCTLAFCGQAFLLASPVSGYALGSSGVASVGWHLASDADEVDGFTQSVDNPRVLAVSTSRAYGSGSECQSAYSGYFGLYPYVGTVGQRKAMETLDMVVCEAERNDLYDSAALVFKTHSQSLGWSCWHMSGEPSGRRGKRMEAVRIKLARGSYLSRRYDVYYRAHVQGYGWMGWAKNGQAAGTTGRSRRLEAVQILLVRKGRSMPSDRYKGCSRDFGSAFVG